MTDQNPENPPGSKGSSLWRLFAFLGEKKEGEGTSADGGQKPIRERRKTHRYSVGKAGGWAEEMGIRVRVGGVEFTARLTDLSAEGVGIDMEGAGSLVPLHTDIPAWVVLNEVEIPITLSPVNRTGHRVGCKISGLSPLWSRTLHKFVQPLEAGRNLTEVDPRYLQQKMPGHTLRWFQGGPSCDLFAWFDGEGKVKKAQLFFFARAGGVDTGARLRTGAVEASNPEGPGRAYPMSKVFQFEAAPDGKTIAMAQRLLAASSLPVDIRRVFGL